MKKALIVVKEIIVDLVILFQYLFLIAFYVLYVLLAIEYGKLPDDNIWVTKSKYLAYLEYLDKMENSKINSFGITFVFTLILLRLFKIKWISIKQVLLFIGFFILFFFLMFIDPFNAFKWCCFD